MRIGIVGGGRMGFALAQQLDHEGHEIYLVDPRADQVELARVRLDAMAREGSGCDLELLREMGLTGADLWIAVSGSDEVNIVSCLVARELGAKRRIARIESSELAENMRSIPPAVLGVDEFVNPREVTVERLHHIVSTPGTTMSAEFEEGKIVLRGLWVEEGSQLTGSPLASLQALFADHFLVAAVKRGENLFVPSGQFQIQAGDVVYVVMAAGLLEEFLETFHFQVAPSTRVFLFGASDIALDLALRLEDSFRDVVLLADEREACDRAASLLPKTSVIHGSPLDQDLMIDLKVETADAFLGLSQSEELNFSSALLARRLGARSSLMLTRTPEHVALFDTLPLDAVVNPAILSVGAILRSARAGTVLSLFKIAGDLGEAIEVEALRDAPAVGKPLKDCDLPDGMVVAAVTGPAGPRVAGGGTVIEPGNRVVLVALKERIRQAIKAFSPS